MRRLRWNRLCRRYGSCRNHATICQGNSVEIESDRGKVGETEKPTLAIIGGGLAGLISCRIALSSKKYSKIRVFEKESFFGGNWTPSEERKNTTRTVYEDLRYVVPPPFPRLPSELSRRPKRFLTQLYPYADVRYLILIFSESIFPQF